MWKYPKHGLLSGPVPKCSALGCEQNKKKRIEIRPSGAEKRRGRVQPYVLDFLMFHQNYKFDKSRIGGVGRRCGGILLLVMIKMMAMEMFKMMIEISDIRTQQETRKRLHGLLFEIDNNTSNRGLRGPSSSELGGSCPTCTRCHSSIEVLPLPSPALAAGTNLDQDRSRIHMVQFRRAFFPPKKKLGFSTSVSVSDLRFFRMIALKMDDEFDAKWDEECSENGCMLVVS